MIKDIHFSIWILLPEDYRRGRNQSNSKSNSLSFFLGAVISDEEKENFCNTYFYVKVYVMNGSA